MDCENKNTDTQNNMDVNYNMTIEHKLKCFKLRTKAPHPKLKPEYYMKLPTYEWAKYIYVDEHGILNVVLHSEDLPGWAKAGGEQVRAKVRAQLFGWTAYSVKERRATIQALIAEMKSTGVSGKEFEEILQEFDDG